MAKDETPVDRLEGLVDRLAEIVKPPDFAALETKVAKLEAAVELAKSGFSAIEQLPNTDHEERGPMARAALAAMAQALK